MDNRNPRQVGGNGLAARRILRHADLTQRRRLELDLGTDDGLQLCERFGFVEELSLPRSNLQLLATGTEAIRIEHPKRLFQQADASLARSQFRFLLSLAPAQLLDLTFEQGDARRAIHGLGACIDSAFEHAKIIACLSASLHDKKAYIYRLSLIFCINPRAVSATPDAPLATHQVR
jgi:hypothetical protein